ncbi:MAG TPA: aldose epimerase family protein [Chloroflexota bacterium]|nr:aldose epimerase family protein [Chloroflexota bacterium]
MYGAAHRLLISAEPLGELHGQPVERYTLTEGQLRVRILTYGGIIQTLEVPDRAGQCANVALGFARLDEYFRGTTFFGAIIGRFANRIAGGRFSLDGVTYALPTNNGPNSLHGGTSGFDQQLWRARVTARSLHLTYTSPDGDQGYPGELTAEVTYTLGTAHDLRVEYRATTDRPTIVNFTNHSYFNLAGEGTGDVGDHLLTLHAERYTPIDATLIPTGAIAPVAGTPLDFRTPRPIGERIRDGFEQLVLAQGYDHNFVLNRPGPADRELLLAAVAEHPASGRVLEVLTTEPGIQFYSGNFLTGAQVGTGGRTYRQGDGFTLETQHYPDSPNQPDFPSTVLRPGEIFASTTVFRFSTTAPRL